jgi:putative transposase
MARPLRIEFPNAPYHITSRGIRCEEIYLDDNDRAVFLDLLLQVRERFNWVFHSYQVSSKGHTLFISRYDPVGRTSLHRERSL